MIKTTDEYFFDLLDCKELINVEYVNKECLLDISNFENLKSEKSSNLIDFLTKKNVKKFVLKEKDFSNIDIDLLNKIINYSKELHNKSGKFNIYIGIYFLKGIINHSQKINSPLVLFPINLSIEKNKIFIENIKEKNILLNNILFFYYKKITNINFEFEMEFEKLNIKNLKKWLVYLLSKNNINFEITNKNDRFVPYNFDYSLQSNSTLLLENNIVLGIFNPNKTDYYKDFSFINNISYEKKLNLECKIKNDSIKNIDNFIIKNFFQNKSIYFIYNDKEEILKLEKNINNNNYSKFSLSLTNEFHELDNYYDKVKLFFSLYYDQNFVNTIIKKDGKYQKIIENIDYFNTLTSLCNAKTNFGITVKEMHENLSSEKNFILEDIENNFSIFKNISFNDLEKILEKIKFIYENLNIDCDENFLKYRKNFSSFEKKELMDNLKIVHEIFDFSIDKFNISIFKNVLKYFENNDFDGINLLKILKEKKEILLKYEKILSYEDLINIEKHNQLNTLLINNNKLSSDSKKNFKMLKINYSEKEKEKIISLIYNSNSYINFINSINVLLNTKEFQIKKKKNDLLLILNEYISSLEFINDFSFKTKKLLTNFFKDDLTDLVSMAFFNKTQIKSNINFLIKKINDDFDIIKKYDSIFSQLTNTELFLLKTIIDKFGKSYKRFEIIEKIIKNTFYNCHLSLIEKKERVELDLVSNIDFIKNNLKQLNAEKEELICSVLQKKQFEEVKKFEVFNSINNEINLSKINYEANKSRNKLPLKIFNEKYYEKGLSKIINIFITTPEIISSIFPLKENLIDVLVIKKDDKLINYYYPLIFRAKEVYLI